MSIIHDALKKVQQNMQEEKKDKVEVLPAPPSAKIEKKKQSSPWLLIIVSSIVIGGSAVYIFTQIHTKYPQFLSKIHIQLPSIQSVPSTKPTVSAQTTTAVIKPTLPALSLKPMKTLNPLKYISFPKTTPATKSLAHVTISQTESTTTPPIVLNVQGIMANPKGNLALIGNEIYEEGAVIQGVKIVKINLNAIIIEQDGKQETIAVRK